MHLRSDKVLVLTLTTADKRDFALTDKIGASINMPFRNAAITAKAAVHCHSFSSSLRAESQEVSQLISWLFKEHTSVALLCYCL